MSLWCKVGKVSKTKFDCFPCKADGTLIKKQSKVLYLLAIAEKSQNSGVKLNLDRFFVGDRYFMGDRFFARKKPGFWENFRAIS